MIFKNLISNPQKVFLLDAFGAVLSAFSLGFILVQFENLFGMPKEKLYYLASVAVLFSVYSFVCYFRFPKNWQLFLAIIATSNLIYALTTLGLIISLYESLTIFGLAYFVLEIMVLILLVLLELKTIRV